jgi:hypothetical protein
VTAEDVAGAIGTNPVLDDEDEDKTGGGIIGAGCGRG